MTTSRTTRPTRFDEIGDIAALYPMKPAPTLAPEAPGLILALSATAQAKPWPALGDDLPKQIDGQPVAYAWKELIRDGEYTHPVYGWTLNVTADRRDKWAKNYERMAENGVKVFLPTHHTEEFKATDNLGYLMAVRNEGASLWGLAQLIGDDAQKAAARNDVSIYLQPRAKDGLGNVYDEAITHVAVCPDPVVPGLEGFQPLAASSGTHGGALVFQFSQSLGAIDMDATPEQVDAVKAILGDGADADDVVNPANAFDMLIAWGAACKRTYGMSRGKKVDGQVTVVSTVAEDLKKVATAAEKAKADAETEKAKAMSRGQQTTLTDDLAEEYAGAYTERIEALTAAGHVLPACAEKLKGLVRKDGKPNAMAFSRSGVDNKPLFGHLLDALKENRALSVTGRPMTGANVLGQVPPGTETKAPGAEAGRDLTKEMIALANGK